MKRYVLFNNATLDDIAIDDNGHIKEMHHALMCTYRNDAVRIKLQMEKAQPTGEWMIREIES